MSTLKTEYLNRHGGCVEEAAVALARDLRDSGDPARFKQGYTPENAAIAASEVFGVARDTVEARLAREHRWTDASGETFTITESDPEIARSLLAQIWGADPDTLREVT